METQKPMLKDEDGKEVDVHMYRSTIGSLMYLRSSIPDIMFVVCTCARYQVNPKVSHLHAMKRIFSARKRQWLQIPQHKLSMWLLQVVVDKCFGFRINYLIMGKAKKSVKLMMEKLFRMELELMLVKTINGEAQLHALVDGKKIIITEASVRRDLQLADEEGVDCLPNSTIFEQLTLMGPKTTAWNEFSSTMASAIICLATNQKFNFSKFIFESMIRNLDNLSGKFLMYPRKPKRKDTQVPQPSDPIENVADDVVHKELGNSLVRAATTASSLEAKQDISNINKTQSKETPIESSSLGTTLGGGPMCQETMGDTIAQTKFESVSKHFNDSLLARGNTLRSDEDRLKLDELMALCTTLQNRVLDLEKTKTTQHNEIVSLKRRVKKLEKKNRSRTLKLIRLYKVSLTARVESSDNEESLGEDASKQGRIDATNADKEITLASVQNVDEEMFDVNVLDGGEVFVAEQEVVVKDVNNVVSTPSDATTVSAAITTTATITTVDDITLAQALMEIKSTKPKEKGVVIQELGESTTTISLQISSQQSQDKAKFDEEERLAREKAEKEKEANIALIETWDDIQAKIDVDHQLAERLQAQEQEELSIEEKATLFQQLLEKRRKHFAAKRA
ncbi:hypothetical protein Tco_0312852 [Tanacetum coccineum]